MGMGGATRPSANQRTTDELSRDRRANKRTTGDVRQNETSQSEADWNFFQP
jgi:hypothetical protein